MDTAEKAKEIASLLEIVNTRIERKKRIERLNGYDHELEEPRPFSVEFGGGSVHTKIYIRSNELGDKITKFFTDIFDQEINAATIALDDMIK